MQGGKKHPVEHKKTYTIIHGKIRKRTGMPVDSLMSFTADSALSISALASISCSGNGILRLETSAGAKE